MASRIAKRRRSMFWLLCLKSLQLRRPQALLGMGSLLAGAAICSLLLNLYGGVAQKVSRSFSSFGANVLLTPRSTTAPSGALMLAAMSFRARAAVESLRQFPDSLAVPELFAVVHLNPAVPDPQFPNGENVAAVGAPLANLMRMNSNWRFEGGTTGSGSGCLVGGHLASAMGLRPGSELDLRALSSGAAPGPPPKAFRVAAVVSAGGSGDDQIFVPLESLQRITGLSGKVSVVEVRVPAGRGEVEAAMRALAAAFPDLAVRPVRQIVYSETRALATIQRLMIVLTALILGIIVLCVAAVMSAIVLERRKDVAVMKALGASDGTVMQIFLCEGAVLGLLGGVAGFFVGAALARAVGWKLFGVTLPPVWWVLPAVCLAAALLAALATLFPVRVVRAIQPALALKGQ